MAGNTWVGAWLLAKLESPYVAMAHPAHPFDAICVLGGGSFATPNGDARLGPAGDRLIVPARLFLSARLPWSAMYAVPQSRGFQNVQKALWEILGGATGG